MFVVAVGSAFVLGTVIETLATWLTGWIRDALALALGRGGRRSVAKSRAMTAISAKTPQCVLLFFMFGV